jgi:hypothetical protein
LQAYLEAAERHLLAIRDGQWFDPESHRPHMAHIAATAGIVLDADVCKTLINDLFTHGQAANLMLSLEKK